MASKLAPGQKAPMFKLPSAQGSSIALADTLAGHKAVVVTFICNHCPYVQAYIPRLIAIQNEFQGRAAVLGINSNDAVTYPEDSFEQMKSYARKWGLNFPYLRDEDQSVAAAWGAERTPEVFVISADGVCRYEGGIDDSYQDERKVKQRPLRDALLAVVEGREVAMPKSYAIGCSLKWKRQ